jgi:poly(ADP-ribose) glycohydrolase ARH3
VTVGADRLVGSGTGPDPLLDRAAGAMLGAAVGDALGARFRGQARVDAKQLTEWWTADQPLRHTDHTRMMIAVAECIVERGTVVPEPLAMRMAQACREDPWRRSGGTPDVFRLLADGLEWAREPDPTATAAPQSAGAASRATPVGILCVEDPESVEELAGKAARPTDGHRRASEAAAVHAGAVAAALTLDGDAGNRRAVVWSVAGGVADPALRRGMRWLAGMPDEVSAGQIARGLGCGGRPEQAVPAAIAAFVSRGAAYDEVVRFAVGLGGDADAVGCMAGALAGAAVGERGLPPALVTRLESPERLRRLGHTLVRLRRGARDRDISHPAITNGVV